MAAIWIAEDDEDDRFLLKKALADNDLADEAHFVRDGQELIDDLSLSGGLPRLILLDLNMPRLDGREALSIVKADARLRQVPVVILTTSRNPEDVSRCYGAGANSFFTKPLDYGDLVTLIALLKAYWLHRAELP